MKVVLKPGTISSSTLKFSTTDSGYIQLSDMIVRKTTRDRGKALKLVSNQPGEVQNIQSLMWDEEEVNRNMEKIIVRAFNEVWDKKLEKDTTMRMGAYVVALNRMVRAEKIRAIFP
jgi:hypothetical protein